MRGVLSVARRLRTDRRGAALVEFAIILPVMLLLYLGGYQIVDASSCYRRVTTTARSLADLVSQYAIVSEGTMTTILNASSQMMLPYDATGIKVRVTQIRVDGNRRAYVSWSRSKNDTSYPPNIEVTTAIPAQLRSANTALIYSEVTYTYSFLNWVMKPMTFTQSSIMMPRRSPSVTLTTS